MMLCFKYTPVIFFLTISLSPFFDPSSIAKAQTKQQPLRIGVIVPLTGPLAFFGKDYIRTMELALEAEPDIKRYLDLRFEDSAYDSKKAVSAFTKLLSVDKVDAVFSFGGPMLSVLAPISEAKKMPFFASESAKHDCEGKTYCSLFRNEEAEWGMATWQILRSDGRAKIGIVKNQNQFMDTFVAGVLDNKGATEQVTILSDVPPETVDMRAEVLGFKDAKIDALGVYLLPGTHRGLLKAMSELNVRFPLFGVEEFLDPELNHGFEATIAGTLVVAPGVTTSYRSRFESKYGFSAGFFYTPAFYDFIILLRDIAKERPEARGLELMEATRFSGERSGVSGKFSVKKSAAGVYSISFPIGVYRVESGIAKLVDEIRYLPK